MQPVPGTGCLSEPAAGQHHPAVLWPLSVFSAGTGHGAASCAECPVQLSHGPTAAAPAQDHSAGHNVRSSEAPALPQVFRQSGKGNAAALLSNPWVGGGKSLRVRGREQWSRRLETRECMKVLLQMNRSSFVFVTVFMLDMHVSVVPEPQQT